jgi:hypothetical protein
MQHWIHSTGLLLEVSYFHVFYFSVSLKLVMVSFCGLLLAISMESDVNFAFLPCSSVVATHWGECWVIPELKHTQIYMVRQLAYSTELLVCIKHSKKQYKQRRRRKLFSTQLHSLKLSLLFSLLFCSLCVFHTHSRSSSLSLYLYKMGVKGHKSCLDLCPPFVSSTMCQVGD